MRRAILLLTLLVLTLFASSAAAYDTSGQVYLSFAPHSRLSTMHVTPLVPFHVYLLVQIDQEDILGIEGSVDFGTDLIFLGAQWVPQHFLNLTPGLDGTVYNYIVGLGECVSASGGAPVELVEFTLMLAGDANDVPLTIDAPHVGSSVPSSFNGQGPGWAGCDYALYLFQPDVASHGVIINPSVVSTSQSSLGALKAGFEAPR
jgi:hypothetical protein